MLKNKWDVLRKDRGIWQKLVRNETGLGWDPVLGTVEASSEWWSRKLKVTPNAAKFKSRKPLLVNDQETLFSDCVANGQGAWAPNSGIMPQHMVDDEESPTFEQFADGEDEGVDAENPALSDDACTFA